MGSQETQDVCVFHSDLNGCLGTEGTFLQVTREELAGFLFVKGQDLDSFSGCSEVFFLHLEAKHIEIEKQCSKLEVLC